MQRFQFCWCQVAPLTWLQIGKAQVSEVLRIGYA
jgi:hypothetical protein